MASNGANGSVSAWSSLPNAMSQSVNGLEAAMKKDSWWQAFIRTDAITDKTTMAIQSSESDDAILVTVEPGAKTSVTTGPASKADFVLAAKGEQWSKFFDADPQAPYTSWVGLQGMNIKQEGVGLQGNQEKFAQNCHLTTRLLELLRDGLHGPMPEEIEPETDEDYIEGRYIYINPKMWGRCKTFVEKSGTGSQEIVFLHTAGSDSRQYHGVMNDARMRDKCTMYAFDLPAHGRSFPYKNYVPGGHTNNEDAYCSAIADVIRVLKLNKPILCGASMAGQICFAAAIRSDEVGVGGTIPLQGCDHLIMDPRVFNDKSTRVNQALWNPDWIYGMMAPRSPAVNKLLIWQTYSAQAYGIFHGDLDQYFAWDIRKRISSIDVNKCPVFALTGKFDWSTTPEMTQESVSKIKGAEFKAMDDLGHFPATENPKKFIPYLVEAIDWINKTRKF